MLKFARAVAVALLLMASPTLAAPPVSTEAPKADTVLTVDTPLRQLIADPRTRPVIEKHMPGLPDRLEHELETDQMIGGGSLRDMTADPHIKGMTPEILAKLGAELATAQKAN